MSALRTQALAALAAATLAGCSGDDPSGDAETGETVTGTTTSGPTSSTASGATTTASATESETDSNPGTDTDVGDTTIDGDTDSSTTGEPGESCFDWTSPPGECEDRGDAYAVVFQGDAGILPELDQEPCMVVSLEPTAADEDNLTVDCGEPYDFRIRSGLPHLELPLSAGQDVLVSAHAGQSWWVTGESPSFVIRSTDGDLLVVWVNPIDDYVQLGAEVDVDIAPLSLSLGASGCRPSFQPPTTKSECGNEGATGTTVIQPSFAEVAVGDEPLRLFGGSSAVVPAGAGEVTLVVDTVDLIVCSDPACGDDSGPFSRLSLLAVAPPAA